MSATASIDRPKDRNRTIKLQHWCGFPAKSGWKVAPVLEFVFLTSPACRR